MAAVLPEPPHTPVSSTASSFLSFSPDAPATPSSSLYSSEATPRALRTAIMLEAPPQGRMRSAEPVCSPSGDVFDDTYGVSPASTTFSSRNPFAAILAAQSSSPSSASTSPASSSGVPGISHTSGSSASSSSNASTPTQGSEDDDVVVFEGAFVNPAALPAWPGDEDDDVSSVLFEAFGVVDGGDTSSTWEDELYNSLSESSPTSPSTFANRSWHPSSPSKSPRSGSSSPRKPRRTAASPRHHPFRHASRTASPIHSPRRSTPVSPARSRPLSRSPSSTTTILVGSALSYSTTPALQSAQVDGGFHLHPTSPVYQHQQQQQRSLHLPFMNLTLAPSPSIRLTPPKSRKTATFPSTGGSKTSRSKSKSRGVLNLDDKLAARAERRKVRQVRELAEDGRSVARTAEGFDAEALDRFFGITLKHAKALKGGYGDVAVREGMVGVEEHEADSWRKVEEFRALLAREEASEEDADMSSVTEASDAGDYAPSSRSCRPRPPPLTLTHSSHSRQPSASTSTLSSPICDDSAPPRSADSLVASLPFSAASAASLGDPLSQEILRRAGEAPKKLDAPRLKHKRSVGDMLKEIFVGGGK
ncbi:hypothetical protein JCM10213_007174 [Rhodosporidiobolus nylandii]